MNGPSPLSARYAQKVLKVSSGRFQYPEDTQGPDTHTSPTRFSGHSHRLSGSTMTTFSFGNAAPHPTTAFASLASGESGTAVSCSSDVRSRYSTLGPASAFAPVTMSVASASP